MRILIITGGNISLPFATDYLKDRSFDRVIAVDAGLSACHGLKITPTDILGDFDSLTDRKLLSVYRSQGVPVREYPSRKDYTDTDLAVRFAADQWEAGDPDPEAGIWILGATGTRMDHTLANIGLLMFTAERGIPCRIVDNHNEMEILKGPAERRYLRQTLKEYYSVFAFSPMAKGIDLVGFSYPMTGWDLPAYASLGVSNELAESQGIIRIREGCLLVVRARD